MTMTRMSGSASSAAKLVSRSRTVGISSAFITWGRLMVRMPTGPLASVRTLLPLMITPLVDAPGHCCDEVPCCRQVYAQLRRQCKDGALSPQEGDHADPR